MRRTSSLLLTGLGLAALVACDPPQLPPQMIVEHGLQDGTSPAYTDLGPADPSAGIRALIALPIREPELLDAALVAMYDPASPSFRRYLTRDAWMAQHAPPAADVADLTAWIAEHGLTASRVASNRLLVQVDGTVEAFNAAFDTELHLFAKTDDAGFKTYGALTNLWIPRGIGERISALVVGDLPADDGTPPMETGEIESIPPPDSDKLRLPTVAAAYGVDTLTGAGFTGAGQTIAVVVGATFKYKDLQSFWRGHGVTRTDPEVVTVAEPAATRFTETTLDIEWAGGIAPGAKLIVYAGPDARDTSLVYAFNEAIGDARAQVLTDSFAHREDATPREIRRQYDASARMGAALGMTLIAAGGDSGKPDVPGSSPWVTSVGGTILARDANDARREERAWILSGSGDALSFPAPAWQAGLPIGDKRAVSDVALAAGTRHWVYVFGEWQAFAGTSFSAPVFAGLIAVVNSKRAAAGKPAVGFLNSILYTDPAVQATFLDITTGNTTDHYAGPGWDYPTGWGAPNAAGLADALP